MIHTKRKVQKKYCEILKLKVWKQDKCGRYWSQSQNTCPKVRQVQVVIAVSVHCWHATPVANVLWISLAIWYKFCNNFEFSKRRKGKDLTQSYDESPSTHRKFQKATWQHKSVTETSIIQRLQAQLRTVSWSNDSQPTYVVKPVYGIPLSAKAVKSKGQTLTNMYIILLMKTENQQPTKAEKPQKALHKHLGW